MKFKVILFTVIMVVFVLVGASNSAIVQGFRSAKVVSEKFAFSADGADSVSVDSVISLGAKYLGKPYRYKGDAAWDLDCSGFISHIYSKFGVKLPKSSTAMEGSVTKIDFDQVAKGDILFFKGRDINSNSIGHVALVINVLDKDVEIMHSCSRGILTEMYPGLDYYNRRFLFAGRIKDVPLKSAHTDVLVSESGSTLSDTISIIGVGDMMLGTNYPSPSYLPPNDGRELLAPVKSILESADLTFGNLEGTILSGVGTVKTCNDPAVCYAFKSPDNYVNHYVEAGFDVLSLANNHSGDFGSAGKSNTMKLLKEKGISFAGLTDCPYTTFEKDGVKYGFCAFAPNSGAISINDPKNAVRIVQHLDSISDVVIVSFHGGAEGAANVHITRKTELYLGENRGNPYQFARDVIDAGADVVFGHGPHVTRAIDLYKGRFIAYSLGNFATYGRFNLKAQAGIAPIVKVHLDKQGVFINGQIFSIQQLGEGGPILDPSNGALNEIIKLTQTDIPESPITINNNGIISLK
jgi:poly-gamma-glutamate capsule biosynthesis protein CapA/YwtB (metallophosphatase superfamily)